MATSCNPPLCRLLFLFLLTALALNVSASIPLESNALSSRLPSSRRVLKGVGSCDDCRAQLAELRKWYEDFQAEQVGGSEGDGDAKGKRHPRLSSGLEGAVADGGASVGDGLDAGSLADRLQQKQAELKELQEEFASLKLKYSKVSSDKSALDQQLKELGGDWEKKALTPEAMEAALNLVQKCASQPVTSLNKKTAVWKGYACSATEEELQAYLDYEPLQLCPDDWFLVQHLIFVRNCFALPKRRCLNRTPPTVVEPMAFPTSLFDPKALADESVRWNLHRCKSFECLNSRSAGDCRSCFDLEQASKEHWGVGFKGSLSIKDVIGLKKGTLRIGLDVGGGAGNFAAHMAQHNVTIMTSAMNIETVKGRRRGLPYLETIALRGLVPLWLPHKGRLPFFDNTLDLVHSTNSFRYLSLMEFEDLMFEWDRVLRVGGVLWLEMFHASGEDMPTYIAILELLRYNKLHWKVSRKDGRATKGTQVFLNCVLEKPVRKDPQ